MAGSARSKDYVEEATWRKLLVPLGAIFGIVIVIIGLANPRRAIALTPTKPNETPETPH